MGWILVRESRFDVRGSSWRLKLGFGFGDCSWRMQWQVGMVIQVTRFEVGYGDSRFTFKVQA